MSRHPFLLPVFSALAMLAGAPAQARTADVEPSVIAELQPGDRRLSCDALAGEIGQMNAIMLYGSPEGRKSKGATGLSVLRKAGGDLVKGKVVRTAVSLTGPIGAVASNVLETGGGEHKRVLKLSAQARHDRLISLYDRKGCA